MLNFRSQKDEGTWSTVLGVLQNKSSLRLNKNSTLKHSISLKTGDKLIIFLAENSKGN
jgi:hypothetical protein